MELFVRYYRVQGIKQTSIKIFNNWYVVEGYIGDDNIGDLYDLMDAILEFEIENEQDFIISDTQYKTIPKEIKNEFWIDAEVGRA